MPLLGGFGAAQASLQNHLGQRRARSPARCKVPPCSLTVGDERRREPSWEGFQFPRKVHTFPRSRLVVKAVPNLEPKSSAGKEDALEIRQEVLYNDDTDYGSVDVISLGKGWAELDERERTRRMRISKANKGMTAWNKGRKHSPETIQRIKEKTTLAMQDHKVKIKMLMSNLGRVKSEETKLKIAAGLRKRWQKYRETLLVEDPCYFEWQNLIAEASRNGYAGQEVLQWNSYQILSEKHDADRVQSAKMSPEQRNKIGESMASKWADPVYRGRVLSGIAEFYETRERATRKPRERPSDGVQSRNRSSSKQQTDTTSSNSSRLGNRHPEKYGSEEARGL